jgi:GNAT superfamily N-acetyltransferase
MLRPAVAADLPALIAIRDDAGDDALSDPALVGEAGVARLVAAGAVVAWTEDGRVAGFAAIDGSILHLLVDSAARGKGVGRELLAAACVCVKQAGHAGATLSLAPGGSAERHYRAAGWTVIGRSERGGTVLQKPL